MSRLLLLALALAALLPAHAAEPQTVCTITVNSPDEKNTFSRFLPASKYRFVELVERGRPDWLASACQKAVSCDVLIVSGHFDGSNEFFSDKLEASEFLPVSELERVSCSGGCPSLFSKLKEVYLFGCNTLNPESQSSASAEIVRGLVREGRSPKEARRQFETLTAAHGETSRDRMRQIFANVPVIYGFASSAPLGPLAAQTLERYFRASGEREFARGHPSGALLGYFAPFSLAAAAGITADDPHAGARADMCRFADDRLTTAERLGFVHGLLQRDSAESWLYLDRMQRLLATLDGPTRRQDAVAHELDAIARDAGARRRFLDDARDAQQPPLRVGLVDLAQGLGWLSDDERWKELALMLGELQARPAIDVPEVSLACRLNAQGELDGAFNRRVVAATDDVAHAALRACLGSDEARARTLAALLSRDEAEVRIAQAYLRQRPITDAAELRRLADGIAAMPPGDAQAHAIEALGRHYVADREVLARVTRLYAETPSWAVQNAIAGLLVRADPASITQPERLLQTLVDKRRKAPGHDGLLDALIARLQSH